MIPNHNNPKKEFQLNDVVRVLCPCGNDTFVKVVTTAKGLAFTSILAEENDVALPIDLLPFDETSIYPTDEQDLTCEILKGVLRSEGTGEHRIRWRRLVKLYNGEDTYVD